MSQITIINAEDGELEKLLKMAGVFKAATPVVVPSSVGCEVSNDLSVPPSMETEELLLPPEQLNDGYSVMPPINKEKYTDLSSEGLEGPFMTKNGKVVYYDPKAGLYYDRDSDFYLTHDEYAALNEDLNDELSPNEPVDSENDYYSFDIGQHFVGALVYGDLSGLTETEIMQLDAFVDDLPPHGVWEFEDTADFGMCAVSGQGDNVLSAKYVLPAVTEDSTCAGSFAGAIPNAVEESVADDATINIDPSNLFPNGAVKNKTDNKKLAPTAAKNGDNPLQETVEVKRKRWNSLLEDRLNGK